MLLKVRMKRPGDGLAGKVLASQARASTFNPQKPPFKKAKVGGVRQRDP